MKFEKAIILTFVNPSLVSIPGWIEQQKINSFRLWNFLKSPFTAKDMVLRKLTQICNQYQL